MSNGPIFDLVAKGKIDEELIDIANKTSIFNFNNDKLNKYAKGDTIFYADGNPNWGNTIRFKIEKKGDLLYGLYLVVTLPKLSVSLLNTPTLQNENDIKCPYRVHYTDFIGNAMIDKISLYFNGLLIDEQHGDYMQFYTDLYISDWNRKMMLGTDDIMNKPNLKIDSENIYIPFKFWFCNDIKKPLPVIAMQYTDIYIDVKFRNFNNVVNVLEGINDNMNQLYQSNITHKEVPLINVTLQANFYYLDLVEREKFATMEYKILMTQSQLRKTNMISYASLNIDFNNVVKDMMFIIHSQQNKTNGEYFNLSAKLRFPPNSLENSLTYELWNMAPRKHLLVRARMLFDGIERIEWRDAKYYYNMQNHENYKNTVQSYVYVYSFTSNPTKDTNFNGCNFSRIENPYFQIEVMPETFVINSQGITYTDPNPNYEFKCYATSFNFLVIQNGIAALEYQY
jgi:hypothetical protein